ncbi:oligosaccharide flippase family protein [Aneurinibacillus uraniidurans]|uniref:oligosaccharide flippase family protein n=1 Tax=Aneurinibacillus uraniidurans TaxID=2966586 RepID=UPI00234ACB77|nr:oligosaccharide flippase family protein [Aneurinibacillus sp. B1]WCN36906.1 oligosaccharide flippase family protein [Aneurinibacillus sp. B1]
MPVFLKQMALRSSAIFIVKLMGALARIPLFRLLGAEGVGLYQMAYSFYGLILTIITAGFPTALFLMTAKDAQRGKNLVVMMLVCLAVIGGGIGYLSYRLAPDIALFMGDQNLTVPIQYIAPALVVVPLLHLVRGYLQGIESYGSIASSEVIEQLVRVCTMLGFATVWAVHGKVWAVSGAVFGAFTGAVCALLFLIIPLRMSLRVINGERLEQTISIGLPVFLYSSVTILATRLVVPVSEFLDALIVPHRLQDGGMSADQAIAVFGEIAGMAVTAVYFPTIMTAAISHTLSAKITEDWKDKKNKIFVRRSHLALQLTWGLGVVSTLFLFFYARDVSMLLFNKEEVGGAIRYLCAIPLLTGLREVTTTILWAQEREQEPVKGLLFGSACSVVLGYLLIAIPGFGYEGTVISILSLELVSVVWNMKQIKKSVNRIFLFMPALWEAFHIVMIGIGCFWVIGAVNELFFYTWPIYVQEIEKMVLFYGGLVSYMGLRFVKRNGLTIFF